MGQNLKKKKGRVGRKKSLLKKQEVMAGEVTLQGVRVIGQPL